ncbi:unnamed protein product, partial [Adineta steineri]
MNLFLILFSLSILFCTVKTKSNLTLDSFFNYTNFDSLSLSPNGEYLLINTRRPLWNSNSFESIKYTWSPSGKWFFFLLKNNSAINNLKFQYLLKIDLNVEQNIYLYSTENDEIKSVSLGNDIPIAITWSQDDSSLYYATINLNSTDNLKWNDIIQYPLNP